MLSGDILMVAWLYSLASIFAVSLTSLIGVLTLPLREEDLRKTLLYLVSFSAGGLFGDAFLHLIPDAIEDSGFGIPVSFSVLLGIVLSFVVERFLQWRHCHIPTSKEHPHSLVYMNLFGDAVHNLIDGLIIGGSYVAGTPLGVATTLAVLFHEIPQEIGDFGVLLYGGFSKPRALLFNFVTGLVALVGGAAALGLSSIFQGSVSLLTAFAAGSFIYVAGSDLIPELHKEEPGLLRSALQLLAFFLGVMVLFIFVLLE